MKEIVNHQDVGDLAPRRDCERGRGRRLPFVFWVGDMELKKTGFVLISIRPYSPLGENARSKMSFRGGADGGRAGLSCRSLGEGGSVSVRNFL